MDGETGSLPLPGWPYGTASSAPPPTCSLRSAAAAAAAASPRSLQPKETIGVSPAADAQPAQEMRSRFPLWLLLRRRAKAAPRSFCHRQRHPGGRTDGRNIAFQACSEPAASLAGRAAYANDGTAARLAIGRQRERCNIERDSATPTLLSRLDAASWKGPFPKRAWRSSELGGGGIDSGTPES